MLMSALCHVCCGWAHRQNTSQVTGMLLRVWAVCRLWLSLWYQHLEFWKLEQASKINIMKYSVIFELSPLPVHNTVLSGNLLFDLNLPHQLLYQIYMKSNIFYAIKTLAWIRYVTTQIWRRIAKGQGRLVIRNLCAVLLITGPRFQPPLATSLWDIVENVPSAQLPQMKMSSWGNVPDFSLTPIWPGYPQLGCYQYHQPIVLGSLWWRLWSVAIN